MDTSMESLLVMIEEINFALDNLATGVVQGQDTQSTLQSNSRTLDQLSRSTPGDFGMEFLGLDNLDAAKALLGIPRNAVATTSMLITDHGALSGLADDDHPQYALDTDLAGYQPLDVDLTAIAALTPTNDDIIQRKAGAWTNRTIAQLTTDLGLGSVYQPLDADLTSWAAVTRAAAFDTFAAQALGATTTILVGGGVGVVPVWTTATGTNAPVRGTGPTLSAVKIQDGVLGLLVGADSSATTLTDATIKIARVGTPHYTNAEEPAGVLVVQSNTTDNLLSIGGGSGSLNAATRISFYTAANNTTVTGTEVLRIGTSSFYPVTAGGMSLGGVANGFYSLFLDESGAGTQTAQIIAPVLASDIVLTTPAITATLTGQAAALTSTRIPYIGTTGLLTDTANLNWDNAQKRFGIGVASPLASIHIEDATPIIRLTDTDTGADSTVSASSSVGFLSLNADINNEVAGSGIGFAVDGTTTAFINPTAFAPNTAGLIALGTSSLGFDSLFLSDPANDGDTAQLIPPSLSGDVVWTGPASTATLPGTVAEVNLTAQGAALTNSTLYTPPSAGVYLVTIAITLTRAATTSSIVGAAVNLDYTTGDGSIVTAQAFPMTNQGGAVGVVSGSPNNVVGETLHGSMVVYAAAAAMVFDVAYTSVGATSMQYAVRARVVRLN